MERKRPKFSTHVDRVRCTFTTSYFRFEDKYNQLTDDVMKHLNHSVIYLMTFLLPILTSYCTCNLHMIKSRRVKIVPQYSFNNRKLCGLADPELGHLAVTQFKKIFATCTRTLDRGKGKQNSKSLPVYILTY